MIKVLFVCHGNICRSPMAEFILKSKTKDIYCESRATSNEEIGNDIYPPAKQVMDKHGITYSNHRATRISQKDYDEYDYIYVMDETNLINIDRVVNVHSNRISKLLINEDIEDAWWTVNFEKVFKQIEFGIDKLIERLV